MLSHMLIPKRYALKGYTHTHTLARTHTPTAEARRHILAWAHMHALNISIKDIVI